jgi:ABC-type multidrug transport system fused ATPase/permease subunit
MNFKSTLVINLAVSLVLVPFRVCLHSNTLFWQLFAASLAVKEFNSKTNICFTTTILFLKRALVVCLGCTFTFRDTNFIFNFIATLFWKKHILEVDSVHKNMIFNLFFQMFIETNDIIGLLGRNGSGKSTLLKIIFELKMLILSSWNWRSEN